MAIIVSKKANDDSPATTRDTRSEIPSKDGQKPTVEQVSVVWEDRPRPEYDALVCGAGGFIGGHLVNMLARKGLRVVAVDIKPTSQWLQMNTEGLVRNMHSVDLRIKEKCDYLIELTKPDIVYNMMDSPKEQLLAQNIDNLLANTHLLQTFINIHQPKKYVLIGGETTEKLLSEEMARDFGFSLNSSVYIARLHNIYGPQSNILDIGELIPIGFKCSYCYIDDAISALWQLTQTDHTETINIGSGKEYTEYDIKGIMNNFAEQEIESMFSLYGPVSTVVDEELTKNQIGWKPSTEIEEGLKKTNEWLNRK